jgi:hypothetical protein
VFLDEGGLTAEALGVLHDPKQYRRLGQAGRALIEQEYSLEKTVPQFLWLIEKVRFGDQILSQTE